MVIRTDSHARSGRCDWHPFDARVVRQVNTIAAQMSVLACQDTEFCRHVETGYLIERVSGMTAFTVLAGKNPLTDPLSIHIAGKRNLFAGRDEDAGIVWGPETTDICLADWRHDADAVEIIGTEVAAGLETLHGMIKADFQAILDREQTRTTRRWRVTQG